MNNFDLQFMNRYLNQQKSKPNLLWIDDIRKCPNNYIGYYNIYIAKNYKEAIYKINRINFGIICLDHDLGEDKTGYDICKYIINKHINIKEYRIHTSNPVGRDNMVQLLRHYTQAKIIIM